MANIGAGEVIYDLRKKIQEIRLDLEQLGNPAKNIPEMIESSNLIRSNEYLLKSNEKKTELLDTYDEYSRALEELLSIVFEIQQDLKEILKEQSALISNSPKKQIKSKKK